MTSPSLMVEYNNSLYVVFSTAVYKWLETTTEWSADIHDLDQPVTSAVVHGDYLFFAYTDDFERFDGDTNTWVTGNTLTGSAKPALFLLNWDNRLLRLSPDGELTYSLDSGATWVSIAQSHLAAGSFNSLFLARNSADYIVPYLGTKEGLYELDFDNGVWLDTGLKFPRHNYACKGATMWRDAAAYIPVGMEVYQYITSSNPIIINPMGPDRDYGMPREYRGNIIQILPEHNHLYALLSAASQIAQDTFACFPYWDGVIYEEQGYSALMKWNGSGWAIVKMSGSEDEPVTCALVSSAYSEYRLWFSMNDKIYYIPLMPDLINPLELDDYEAESGGEHIWPWFDADNAVVDKLALSLTAYTEKTSDSEHVQLYYGVDYDENTWTPLTNTDYTDGRIKAPGETEFNFASGSGIEFKAIRFKAVLHRGSDATKYPDLRWIRLDYMKVPDARFTYSVVVDCSKDYRHRRKSTLLDALKTAAETKTLGDFIYRASDGASEAKKVKILSMEGYTVSGKKKEGYYKIGLLSL